MVPRRIQVVPVDKLLKNRKKNLSKTTGNFYPSAFKITENNRKRNRYY